MYLALTYPQTYSAAASLSGAFWPGQETGSALRDRLPALGKQAVAIYLDHGGNPANNSDGAADSIEIRDLMDGMGWQRTDSPSCTRGGDAPGKLSPHCLGPEAPPGGSARGPTWTGFQ